MNDTVTLVKEKTIIAARKVAPYVWPVTRFTLIWTARLYAWFFIMFLWIFQFVVIVPLQLFWRLVKGVGLIAWLVFFFPIGWIVLPFLLYGRAKHGTPILGEKHYSTRPWLLDPLLSIGR